MTQPASKVIGVFAYRSPVEVLCTDGEACLIIGSESAMRLYLVESDPATVGRHTIRKTRFGEIVAGLQMGAAYAFDEAAYARFYPLAREAGFAVASPDFAKAQARGDRFFTVSLDTA